ncbi:unnamed protein product [Phytophthora fragariaefolia]|uniref:Unnamed protein product n=1 Tax=Phytophthora fragariaefolia TaxID=1490495 RepID=A0A9W6YP40_9STRA|nr:unnamed protein product [Phytophthora fragariaefolia]
MKCASVTCSWTELTITDPCVVCGRGVHQLCSNELYDGGSLSERFCSAPCLYQWKTVTSPGPASVPIESEIRDLRDSISQDTVLSTSQASSVPLSQQNDYTSQYPSDTSVVDLAVASTASSITSSSPSNSLVDAFGIPLEHANFCQPTGRHDIWKVSHRLTRPCTKSNGQVAPPYTHVCLLCAQQLTSSPFSAPDA